VKVGGKILYINICVKRDQSSGSGREGGRPAQEENGRGVISGKEKSSVIIDAGGKKALHPRRRGCLRFEREKRNEKRRGPSSKGKGRCCWRHREGEKRDSRTGKREGTRGRTTNICVTFREKLIYRLGERGIRRGKERIARKKEKVIASIWKKEE